MMKLDISFDKTENYNISIMMICLGYRSEDFFLICWRIWNTLNWTVVG